MDLRFICKWSAIGAFSAAGLLLLGILITSVRMENDTKRARKVRTAERDNFVKAKARVAQMAEEKLFQERAHANWKEWRDNFTNTTTGVACYHSHVFNHKERFYIITCHVGDKGKPPTYKVACDQNGCTRSESK